MSQIIVPPPQHLGFLLDVSSMSHASLLCLGPH